MSDEPRDKPSPWSVNLGPGTPKTPQNQPTDDQESNIPLPNPAQWKAFQENQEALERRIMELEARPGPSSAPVVTTVSSDEESDETESIAVAISLCVPLFSTSTTNQEIEAFLRDKKKKNCLQKEILATHAMKRKTETRNHIIGRVIDRLFSTRLQAKRTLTVDGRKKRKGDKSGLPLALTDFLLDVLRQLGIEGPTVVEKIKTRFTYSSKKVNKEDANKTVNKTVNKTAEPTEDELSAQIRIILAGEDFENDPPRPSKVLRLLEDHFVSANLKPKKKELRDLMQKIVDEMGEEDSDSSSDDLPLQKIVPNAAWKVRAEEKQDDNMQDDSDNLEDMDSDSEDVREDLDNYRKKEAAKKALFANKETGGAKKKSDGPKKGGAKKNSAGPKKGGKNTDGPKRGPGRPPKRHDTDDESDDFGKEMSNFIESLPKKRVTRSNTTGK